MPQRAPTVAEFQERLGLDERHRPWLDELARVHPPSGIDVLAGARRGGSELLTLRCETSDINVLMETLPSPEADRDRWWLLTHCRQQLVDDMGGVDYLTCRWPTLPSSLGAAGRLFYAHVFLALLTDVRAWHRRQGIPDRISWAALQDLGRRMALYRHRYREAGLDAQDWLTLHFRGAMYELGRLQFHRSRIVPGIVGAGPLFWYAASDAERLGPGFRHGDPILSIHVPTGRPLMPDACDASLRAARAFFQRHFPDETYPLALCTSWLLDDQLADYLPESSNIIRFQRRFRVIPGSLDDDDGILESVFHRPRQSLDTLSARTTLEHAVLAHLRGGSRWRIRTGWLEL